MDLTNINKFIYFILNSELSPDKDILNKQGIVDTTNLIEYVKKTYSNFCLETLEKIVEKNKQNYSFNEDKTLIYLNKNDFVLKFKEIIPPTILYHGTSNKYVESIDKIGLISDGISYIHLTKDLSVAEAVGKRHGEFTVYSIDTDQMIKDGYKFFIHINGVFFTKEVPIKYLKKI